MNKKLLITIGIIIGLTIIVGGFWYFNDKNNNQKQIVKNQNQQNDIRKYDLTSEDSKEIVQNFKNIFSESLENKDIEINKEVCFQWIREDGINFGPSNSWGVSTAYPNLDLIKKNTKQSENLLLKNGFKKNKLNQEEFKYILGEREGFERNETKCNLTWGELTLNDDPRKYYFEFSCTKMDSESEVDFKNLLIALREYLPPEGYTKIADVRDFCITKKDNNFSKGSVGTISAPTWYAKKDDNKWTVTLITQDHPLCKSVTNFPIDYYMGKCLSDNNGGIEVINE